MPSIHVLKPFNLNIAGTMKKFAAGWHEVEEEIASHWYTLLHIAPALEIASSEGGSGVPGDEPPVTPPTEGVPATQNTTPGPPATEPGPAPEQTPAPPPVPAVEPVAGPEEPPAPAATPDGASVTEEPDGTIHVDTPEEADEKAVLKAQAEALGISVDGRWGVARLKAEIAAKAT